MSVTPPVNHHPSARAHGSGLPLAVWPRRRPRLPPDFDAMRYLRRALPLVTAFVLAATLVSAAPAEAMSNPIECGGVPFLSTAYGPLAQCVHVATDTTGEVGLWSALAHSFNDTTGRADCAARGQC